MYSVFVFCLSPPEECVSFWFRNRAFLSQPGLTEGGNVNLVSTKFPRDKGGPPFGPCRGILIHECAHVPCARSHLFLLILTAFKGKTASCGRLASFGLRMSVTARVWCRGGIGRKRNSTINLTTDSGACF